MRRRAGSAVRVATPKIVAALAEWGVTGVHSFLAHDGHPVLWLATGTDAERDAVQVHGCFADTVRALLIESGLNPELAAETAARGVTVESQETVDRSWDGNWYQAMR